MNTFGLGLVLNFTDKATVGLTQATNAFENLNNAVDKSAQKSSRLTSLENSMFSLGSAMTLGISAPVIGFTASLATAGLARQSFLQDSTIAFKTLMGSAEEAKAFIDELYAFAKTTPFSMETLTSGAQTLKSFGMETEKIIPTLTTLGDTIGAMGKTQADLSGLVSTFARIQSIGKLNGESLMMLQEKGVNATAILGNSVGKTSEEIRKEITQGVWTADKAIDTLIEGMKNGTDGVNGFTAASKGMMENLKSTWTGAKDSFSGAMHSMGTDLIDDTNLEKLTKSLNNITYTVKQIAPLFKPIVDGVVNTVQSISEAIRGLAQWFTELPDNAKTSLSKMLSVLVLIGPALMVIGKLGPAIRNTLGAGASMSLKMFKAVSPLVGLAYVFYYAWKNNLFGIRDLFGSFAENFTEKISLIWDALTDNVLSEEKWNRAKELGILPFIETLLDLKYRLGEFFSGVKDGFKSFMEGFSDLYLSFKDATGIEIGWLEDIITALRNSDPETWRKLGEYAGKFIASFLIFKTVINPFMKFWHVVSTGYGAVTKGFSLIGSSIKGVRNKLDTLTSWKRPNWLGGGLKAPQIESNTPTVAKDALGNAMKSANGKDIWDVSYTETQLEPEVKGVFSRLGTKALNAFKHPIQTAKNIFGFGGGALATEATATGTAVGQGVGTAVSTQVGKQGIWSSLVAGGKGAVTKLGGVFSGLGPMITSALGSIPVVGWIALGAVALWSFKDEIRDFLDWLIEAIPKAFDSIGQWFSDLWQNIRSWLMQSDLGKFIVTILDPIIDFIGKVWGLLGSIFSFIAKGIKFIFSIALVIIKAIGGVIGWLWDNILKPVLSWIGDTLGWLWDNILKPFFDWIGETVNWLWENILKPVFSAIGDAWDFIWTEHLGPFFDWIGEKFGWVGELWGDICTNLGEAWAEFSTGVKWWIDKIDEWFGPIIDTIKWVCDAIGTVMGGIGDFVSDPIGTTKGWIDDAGDWMNTKANEFMDWVGLDTGGYVKSEGLAVLHPNEVVVNDKLTRQLGGFLNTFGATDSEMDTMPFVQATPTVSEQGNYTNVRTSNNFVTEDRSSAPVDQSSTDNSITFEKGSIVIEVKQATSDVGEVEKMAEMLFNKFTRKLNIDGLTKKNRSKGQVNKTLKYV